VKHVLTRAAGVLAAATVLAPVAASASSTSTPAFPRYDHVFLVINENHGYNQIIGNPAAAQINALATGYGLATGYTAVADPSEPNYVAMLGGSTFGISSDDPYFFPGQTINQPNPMSQLDAAGLSWKGYFQDMPYPGYRGYCYPAKCNGIPDSDTQYVAKHNGIVNFANMQNPTDLAKMTSYGQMPADLASGQVPSLSYIVADECNDMHGAPPWCVDSGKPGDVYDTWLVARGDRFVGQTVNAITSSPMWAAGTNAIVVTFDEGASSSVYATGQQAGAAFPSQALIEHWNGKSWSVRTPPADPAGSLDPFTVTGTDAALTVAGARESDTAPFTTLIAAGNPQQLSLVTTPNASSGEQDLFGAATAPDGSAWAVGWYIDPASGNHDTLVEHGSGGRWSLVASPNPGTGDNGFGAVTAIPGGGLWAVGITAANGAYSTLIEHHC
jgi:hypothetical protein